MLRDVLQPENDSNDALWSELIAAKDGDRDFREAILPGLQMRDQVGIFALSKDSFTTWSKVYDPILDKFFKHSADASHKFDSDMSGVNVPELSEEKARLVLTSRVRIVRNFA